MRQVPVWSIVTQPPAGVRLGSRTFQQIATAALREGAALMLPAPAMPTYEELERDGEPESIEVDEPTEEQMLALQSGSRADQAHWTRTWHAMARGITWEHNGQMVDLTSDPGRALFIFTYTEGRTGSLSAFLQTCTEEQAAGLIAALGAARTSSLAARYSEIFDPDAEASESTPTRRQPQPTQDTSAPAEDTTAF
jgi:hypothetical protein